MGAAASFGWLRAFPEGSRDVRESVAQDRFGRSFDALGRVEQAQVYNDPRVKGLPAIQGVRGARTREIGGYQDTWQQTIEKAATDVQQQQITPEQFREIVSDAGKTRGIQLETVGPARNPKEQSALEAARTKYFDILKQVGPDGKPNYDLADAFAASVPGLRADLDQAQLAGYERLTPAAKNLMRELFAAKKTLAPYWEITRAQLERVGLWDQFSTATGPEQLQIQTSPRYKMALRLADQAKERLRRTQPEVDAALVRWGYVSKSIRGR